MALTKNVDGVDVAMTPAEEAAMQAFWATNAAATQSWTVPRLQVINRLAAANKFNAFMDALDDSTQLKRELWHAMDAVPNDTAFVIELLQEAGADPAAILARP